MQLAVIRQRYVTTVRMHMNGGSSLPNWTLIFYGFILILLFNFILNFSFGFVFKLSFVSFPFSLSI